jgi:hypothetical protein
VAGYVTLLRTSHYSPLLGRAASAAAQRIYVRRGYLPNGRGIMYRNQPAEPGAVVRIDDDATLMLTRPVG